MEELKLTINDPRVRAATGRIISVANRFIFELRRMDGLLDDMKEKSRESLAFFDYLIDNFKIALHDGIYGEFKINKKKGGIVK